ncbi:acyl-CoA dehydrogenase family protein [Streptomyces sp. NPDC087425]|uniref:acyl-CoA dehydrogenase family protein n=1 Tax=unclassified Streptomyces TaxID=2593676 RepID=UPI0038214B3E
MDAGRGLLGGPLNAPCLAAEDEVVVRAGVGGAVPLRVVDPSTSLHWLCRGGRGRRCRSARRAEHLGIAGRVCELAVQHARQRQQFGRSNGSFQVVEHGCAGLLARAGTARTAVRGARGRLRVPGGMASPGSPSGCGPGAGEGFAADLAA